MAALAPETAAPSAPADAPAPQPGEAEISQQAAAMQADYALDSPEESENPPQTGQGEEQEEQGGDAQQEVEYSLTFSENFEAQPEFLELVTARAKAAGLDGKAAGAYTEGVILAIQEQEYANMVKTDAELKADWGADYAANKREAKAFGVALAQRAGLTMQDMAVFQSPKGYRLLHELRMATASAPAAGIGRSATSDVDSSYAHEVMHNPNHPDYAAFHEGLSNPRFREVNERYNRAKGII
ncbi:MAG: hypothetical protein ACI4O9_02540 [Akkermansia sp.]